MDKRLDSEFKNRLKKETEEITDLKEEVWNNISSELFSDQIQRTRTNWGKRIAAAIGTVAVAAIMFFGLLSGNFIDQTKDDPIQDNPNQNDPIQGTNDPDAEGNKDIEDNTENDTNDIEQELPLKDRFEHEKTIEIEVEGMKEDVQVQLATNDEWGYIIYYETDNYEFMHGEEMDEIVYAGELNDQYPKTGMEIRKMTDITVEEAISKVKKELENNGIPFVREETVDWPINGVMILGEGNADGTAESDSPVHRYYITEGKNDSLFVFKQMFFVEAWDGSPRFNYMLESFQIVE